MTGWIRTAWAAVLLLTAVACGQAGPELDLAAYEQEVMEWRKGRLERLLAPEGFLTQIGLYWLEPGTYSIGSDENNDIVMPATAAARIGDFHVDEDGVRMIVAAGVEVRAGDEPVSEIFMGADVRGDAVTLSHRSLAWSVIERSERLAVRIRDYEHPFLETFGPLPYYEIDPAFRVTATLSRYDEPRTVAVNTVIEGFQQFPVSPGVAVFELDGKRYELEPTLSGESLFFVFGDETSRGETYGAGRFLYSDAPDADGKFILDFNKSYSAPCAFNDFSTCPVASPRNRMAVRIEAGEKFEDSLHYAGH